jgi:alpha-N-arabinofuranosidase
MYRGHQGAQSLRTVVSAPGIYKGLPGLSCSASLRGKVLTLTVTNPSLDQAREVEIGLRGANIAAAKAATLAAADVHAHNSFENPRAVEPRAESVQATGAKLTHGFAPASVTQLELSLV